MTCLDNYQARGRKKTEVNLPNLALDIRDLVDGQSQADPTFKTTFAYTKVSAQAVLRALTTTKGYAEADLPCRQTMGTILNRLGYRLKNTKSEAAEKDPRNGCDFRARCASQSSGRCESHRAKTLD